MIDTYEGYPTAMDYTREESGGERLDRNWNDLLQEFRVIQTGVQLLGGFLLTLPFHSGFADLDDFQRTVYLVLVLLATTTTACMLIPIAVHRKVFQQHVKHRLVDVGHALARVVLILVAMLITGIAVFIFDIVLDRTSALLVGGFMIALILVALVVIPAAAGRVSPSDQAPQE